MYGLLSDIHGHEWSAFSTTETDGMNSRLKIIIKEIIRAAHEIHDSGGRKMILAGDTFHVRGKVSPKVLNPMLECFEEITKMGIDVIAIPGNHDLESNDADELSNMAQALTKVGVDMCNKPTSFMAGLTRVVVIPYIHEIECLKTTIEESLEKVNKSNPDESKIDLIIHAPVDGVIKGLPDHGLTPEYLAELDCDRVFAGHYHNHVDFGNGVYSIGATTHQTWGDTNSRAGFLLVDSTSVNYRASHAPKFVTIDEDTDPDDIPLIADGNYIRMTVETTDEDDLRTVRDYLKECGAKGVVLNVVRHSASVARTDAISSSGTTLAVSVAEFIKAKEYEDVEELSKLCDEILTEVEEDA